MIDSLLILLNNSISLLMVGIEKFLTVLEIRIKKNHKKILENFDYNTYVASKKNIESYLKLLNLIEKQLTFINKLLNVLNITLEIQKFLVSTISNIPLLPTKVVTILIDVKILISNALKILRVLNNLIKYILSKITRIKILLQDLLDDYNNKLRELLELFKTINDNKSIDGFNGLVINNGSTNTSTNTGVIVFNTNINTNIFKDNGYDFTYKQVELIVLELNDYSKILEDLIKIPQEYKGYIFKIYELDSTIPNIKNRFAVALDNKGVESFRSETSFTLRPSVLIESLKFKIDNHLIENYKV